MAFLISALLTIAAFIATVTILVGAFVLPVAGLLVAASRLQPSDLQKIDSASPGWCPDPKSPGHLKWTGSRSQWEKQLTAGAGFALPGWYADPAVHGQLRWFDGTHWTGDVSDDRSS